MHNQYNYFQYINLIKNSSKRMLLCLYPFGKILSKQLCENNLNHFYPIKLSTDSKNIKYYFDIMTFNDTSISAFPNTYNSCNSILSMHLQSEDMSLPVPDSILLAACALEIKDAFIDWLKCNLSNVNYYLHQISLGGDEPATTWESIYIILSNFIEAKLDHALYKIIDYETPLDFPYIIETAFS